MKDFLEELAPFIILGALCMFVAYFIGSQLDETRRNIRDYEVKVKQWRAECVAGGGHVVTTSRQQLRFNYRNRYETIYSTTCEKD